MTIHLDTSTIIAFLRGSPMLAMKLEETVDPSVSCIVIAELLYGIRASQRPDENARKLSEFLRLTRPIPFDAACAEAYGNIRFELRRAGTPCGEIDTLIAATAIAHGATIVTHNPRHFSPIRGLQVIDWLA